MPVYLVVLFLLALSSAAQRIAYAQSPEDRRTLELVDRLKEVIERVERQPNSNQTTLDHLRALVRRYDWPWRAKLLDDDFGDGDFTANPAWQVGRGEFRVVRGVGLRSDHGAEMVPALSSPKRDAGDDDSTFEGVVAGILKDRAEPGARRLSRRVGPPAEISAPLSATGSFALRLRLAAGDQNPVGSRLEFGLYRGTAQDWGYRLAYMRNPEPALALLRITPGRFAEVRRFDGLTGLEDGRARLVELRRYQNGTMLASVDGAELIRFVDRGVSDFYDGFVILNGGGEYVIERVEVYGAER